MNAIEIRNLHKDLPGFTLDIPELVLPSGCILGLMGENGAGKTTLIKLMLELLRRDRGTVTLLGRAGEPTHLTLQDVGVVPDQVGLPQSFLPDQIGRVMAGVFTRWDQALFDRYLNRFGLPYDKRFKDLSLGMKKKLALAVALSHHASLLILDEATAGLDPVVRDELLDLLLDFTRDEDHSILLSSHIISDLEKLCDYIAFLHRGRLLLFEEKDRLLEKYGLVRCSEEQLAQLPPEAVKGRRISPYGAEALVLRDRLPAEVPVGPVDLEKLFVYTVKEAV